MKKVTEVSVLTLFTVLLAGCVVSETTYTANGNKGHSIDCSGELSSWNECYEEAGDLCKTRGYRVLEKIGEKESNIYADKNLLSGSSSYSRTLIIECR